MGNDIINGHYIQARMNTAEGHTAKSGLLGFGTVILENNLVIKNVRLYEGEDGVFVSFPQRKTAQGYKPYVTCTQELLQEIMQTMLLDLVYQDTRRATVYKIDIYPIEVKGLLAIAAVSFTIGLTVTDIKIIEGKYGPIVIMPHYKGSDLFYPLGNHTRKELNELILQKYMEVREEKTVEKKKGIN